MKDRSSFLAGIFVSSGIFIIILLLFTFFKPHSLLNPASNLYCVYKNISGLKPGADVNLSGYQIGSISDIEFLENRDIMVELEIHERYLSCISQDSVAFISTSGLLGDKALNIKNGFSEDHIKNKAYLAVKEPFDIDDAMQGLESLAGILSRIEKGEGNIGILIKDEQLYENLLKVSENLKEITDKSFWEHINPF